MLVFALLAIQVVLVAWTFPISELLTDTPMFHIDAAFHWYQMKLAANIAGTGALVGYDPFFNAGYPGGVTYNWSAKFPAAVAALFSPWISEVVLYKLLSFTAAVLGPLCVPIAARWLRVGAPVAAVASGLGLILWWASYFRWYHTAGMVTFVMASYFTLPYCALVVRYLRHDANLRLLILLGVIGALATFYHPFFPIPVAFVVSAFIAFFWRDIPRRHLVTLLSVVPLLSLLPNVTWLYPMIHFHHVFSTGVDNLSPYFKIVDAHLIWKELFGVYRDHYHGAKIYLLLALATAWACARIPDATQRRLAWALTASAVALIVFADLGAAIPGVGRLQPNRFVPVGYLLLTIPAAMGVINIAATARGGRNSWLVRGALAALTITVALGGYCVNEVRHEVSYADIGRYGKRPPEVDGVGDYSRWVLAWLRDNTTRDGRVLFETTAGRRIHDGAVMAGYYAYNGDREFIGGPYSHMHFAGFWDGFVFGKPIREIDSTQFAQYLELYNVGWIIALSETTKAYLESLPWIKPVDEFKQLRAYTIDRPLNYLIAGRGRITTSAHNKLTISDLEGDEVVVKYHYVPGIISNPAAILEPVFMKDDPNPFIKIVRPPPSVTLSLPGLSSVR